KKTNDPVLGWVVTISNTDKIATTYESLSKVNVEMNQAVKQGDVIGTSGENVYESDLKNHLHFILQKDGQLYNPEKYLGQPLNTIK
ncbi:MAG: M23 family metallopeptidase, partial [Bacilli bacterium]